MNAEQTSPFTARDYRMFRWALLLPLVGALSCPVLSGVISALPVPQPVHELLASMVSFSSMMLGLLALRGLREDARYRLFIDLALAGSLTAVIAAGLVRLMEGVAGAHVPELFSALALLCFVLALRRLVAETQWAEGLRVRLRRSVFLVTVFWVGTAALLIPLGLLNPTREPVFEKSWTYFLVLSLQGIPAVQVLRVLRDLYRDAGLRNNVLVIKGRRPESR